MTVDRRLRVLLVEDNDLDARTVVRALNKSNDADYEIVHVEDLAGARAHVRDATFDCILLDLSLPDSEGLVSVDMLTAGAASCPVVVLTGLDDPDVAIEAVRRGAQDYLIKSTITPELVERAVRYAVARHHSEVQLASTTDLLETLHDRERIARDLHDTVIQRLFATGMSLQAATARNDLSELKRRALGAVDEIDQTIRELRHAIFELNTISEGMSLATDISLAVEDQHELLGFHPEVRIGAIDHLDGDLHHAVVSVVREGLTNVARHAGATAAEVTVSADDGHIRVTIVDNGKGIATPALDASAPDAPVHNGNGLSNLESRADDFGGRLRVEPAVGGGTRLEWTARIG